MPVYEGHDGLSDAERIAYAVCNPVCSCGIFWLFGGAMCLCANCCLWVTRSYNFWTCAGVVQARGESVDCFTSWLRGLQCFASHPHASHTAAYCRETPPCIECGCSRVALRTGRGAPKCPNRVGKSAITCCYENQMQNSVETFSPLTLSVQACQQNYLYMSQGFKEKKCGPLFDDWKKCFNAEVVCVCVCVPLWCACVCARVCMCVCVCVSVRV